MMSLEGQQIGRYSLLHLLGSGGMGEVYLASDPRINRQVAIKVIRAEATEDHDTDAARKAARLFEREAHAIATLDHPHILPLFDYGEENLNGTTLTYMVTPYRPEGSLAAWLRQHGGGERLQESAFDLYDVAHIVKQSAGALQFAHDHQIIHQDVKPSNFLIRSNPAKPDRPYLLLADFGIAKLTTVTSSDSLSIRGTPLYMAPEQWESHAVPASDQYALAVMAYELLTGRPLFQGSLMQVIYQHSHVQPQPPSTFNQQIPTALDLVLLRALAKKPEDRFPTISAFAQAFEEALYNTNELALTNTPVMPRRTGGKGLTFTRYADDSDFTLVSKGDGSPGDDLHSSYPKATTQAQPAPFMPTTASGRQEILPGTPGERRQKTSRGARITLVALALLLMLTGAGIGLYYYLVPPKVIPGEPNPTAITEPNPYTHGGRLVLNDQLRNNNLGYQWEEGQRDLGGCAFIGGSYHVTQPQQGFFHSCIALNTDFANFVYEVHMTLVTGNYGGMVFRADRATTHFYYFRIGLDGNYFLTSYVDKEPAHARVLASGPSSSINTGLGQTNIIAVVAQGSSLDLYVNYEKVAHVIDNTYSHGQIGVFVGDSGNAADGVFSNVKVWTL